MDFEISEKMKVIIGMIDEFVDKELIPMESQFTKMEFRDGLKFFEEKRKMVKQMELWAPNHPKEYGGMGLDLMDHALVSEALGRTPLGHYIFGCQAPD
ncbi:MAG: acyl-CoA/acyl-ACP dehydrogenase, partial [Deltaproteobacteria bacterium]|nr:acyl-CoA/acyl-ACP dehydrogenase [Deltaproteobacteria bacterium]